MEEDLEKQVQTALLKSWSGKTSSIYTPDNPANGQCSPTSIVIFEKFGGHILCTRIPSANNVLHFYNKINGKRYDFTVGQFTAYPEHTREIEYQDIPSTVEEAKADTSPAQVEELRTAFNVAFKDAQQE